MFDIGWSELVVIGVVALIAIGPKELPGVLRTVGQYAGKLRRMASDFQGQFQEAMREAEMHDLKKQVEELNSAASNLNSQFDPTAELNKTMQQAFAADRPAESPAADALRNLAASPELPPPDPAPGLPGPDLPDQAPPDLPSSDVTVPNPGAEAPASPVAPVGGRDSEAKPSGGAAA